MILASFILPFSVDAQINNWTSGSSGKWETAGNWSSGAPSASNASNVISNATSKTVTLDATTVASGTMTISNLVVSGPSGTTNTVQLTNTTSTALHILNALSVRSGGVLLITNSTLQVDVSPGARTNILDGLTTVVAGQCFILTSNSTTFVGSTNFASGELDVLNGGTMTIGNLRVATAINSVGLVTISGGALFVTNISTIVGGSGNGTLVVTNGLFTTRAMTVGSLSGGAGTMIVTGGSTNNCGTTLTVGANMGATGSVWVTGGSRLTNTAAGVNIGASGTGMLNISNSSAFLGGLSIALLSGSHGTATFVGSTVTVNSAVNIASAPSSTGLVTVIGGLFDASANTLVAGMGGSGVLMATNCTMLAGALEAGISGNGTVSLQAANASSRLGTVLGELPGATGTVWISNSTVTMTNQNVLIGLFGLGRMILSNGTLLADNLLVGAGGDGQGTLTIVAGIASTYSNLVVGDCASNGVGQIILNGGTLAVTNAFHNAVLDVRDGTFTFNGGTLLVDNLVMTNSCGHFIRIGGVVSILSMNLAAGLDADGDGIPNGYEQSHGLDPLNAADTNLDSDGDGMSNLQEYLAGTDPTNNASAFRITSIVRTGSDVLVGWMTGVGKTNALQVTAGAAGGDYATNGFADIFAVTNTVGITTNYLDAGGATNKPARYYRVRLVP